MSDKNEKIEAAEAPKAKAHFDFTKLNTLAVVSLATALTGFGAVAAIITGHISLAQIKKSSESGRPLALAGLILGYVGIALWVLGAIGMGIARIFMSQRYGIEFGDHDGGMRGMDDGMMGGHMGGRGEHDGDGGGMGGGWQMPNGTEPEAPTQSN
jgi:uncharacterized protein with PQ loop repeat